MNPVHTLISLVGKQPMAVVIPILQLNPEEVVLVATKETAGIASNIREALRKHRTDSDAACQVTIAGPVAAYDAGNTCDVIKEHLILREGKVVMVNVTGGTSLMAFGARDAADACGVPMLYLSTDESSIQYLNADATEDEVTVAVPAHTYLKAHGAGHKFDFWGEALEKSVEWVAPYREPAMELGRLGAASAQCINELRDALQPGVARFVHSSEPNRKVLEILSRHKLLSFAPSDNGITIEFDAAPNGQVRRNIDFIGGKWLELYVYFTLRESGFFDEVLFDLSVSRDTRSIGGQSPVKNQIDVLVMRGTKLGVISCKSGRMKPKPKPKCDDSQRAPRGHCDQEVKKGEQKFLLYELDSLLQADLMGLYAAKALVSNQPCEDIPPAVTDRALLSGIRFISGEEFPDLAQIIKDKMDGKR